MTRALGRKVVVFLMFHMQSRKLIGRHNRSLIRHSSGAKKCNLGNANTGLDMIELNTFRALRLGCFWNLCIDVYWLLGELISPIMPLTPPTPPKVTAFAAYDSCPSPAGSPASPAYTLALAKKIGQFGLS